MKKITPQRLKNIALYYLQRYDASSLKLRTVLMRRIQKAKSEQPVAPESTDWVNQVIEQMQNLGYVNDARYAENVVRRLSETGKSNAFIRTKLKTDGIDENLIRQLLSDTDELAQAKLFVRKKRLGNDFKKDLAKLARAGFSYDIATKALQCDDEALFFD